MIGYFIRRNGFPIATVIVGFVPGGPEDDLTGCHGPPKVPAD
jgi:hypothetical protein